MVLSYFVSRLPLGYRYGRLSPRHVPFVFKNWPYSRGEDVQEFRNFFEVLPSAAVFKDSDLDYPVAYTCMYSFGQFGLTFTAPKHRRKGLAKAVTLKLSEISRSQGHTAVIPTQIFNKNSQRMHESIGFKHQVKVHWRGFAPE